MVVHGTGATLPVLTPGAAIDAGRGGATASGVIVATFTDSTPGVTAADFAATIDWGDGSPASAGIVGNGASRVRSSSAGRTPTPRKVGHSPSPPGSPTRRVNRVTTTTTADVADAALFGPVGYPMSASEGVPTVLATLGTFLDANRGATPADFAATIDWGDGSAASTGFVNLVGGSASAHFSASVAATSTPPPANSRSPSSSWTGAVSN